MGKPTYRAEEGGQSRWVLRHGDVFAFDRVANGAGQHAIEPDGSGHKTVFFGFKLGALLPFLFLGKGLPTKLDYGKKG